MSSVLPFTDIIFGNETEAAFYAEVNNLGTTDVGEIALKLAMLPKENGSRSRLVIITQGEGENSKTNKHHYYILSLSSQDPWWLWNTAMLKAFPLKVKMSKSWRFVVIFALQPWRRLISWTPTELVMHLLEDFSPSGSWEM